MMKLVKSYQRDDEAWDWKFITLASAAFRIPNLEVLIVLVILGIFIAIVAANIFFAHLFFSYLWYLYTTRGMKRTPTGHALKAVLAGWVLLWVVSFVLYSNGKIDLLLH